METSQPHDLPPFLTVPQVAKHLAMPESWVYAECRRYTASRGREGLPCRHFGRAVRIAHEDFIRWLEKR